IRKQRREARYQPFNPQVLRRAPAPLAYTVGGAGANVLVLAPPATDTQGNPNIVQAADAFLDTVRGVPGSAQACGLVVDLSGQTGGNAWPGIAALADLITPANLAMMEARDGSRTKLAPPEALEYYTMQLRDENRQLLARFRSLPFAVVVTRQTSSAGEMIGILLKGEARARVFGWPTGGYTTVNNTVPLATGDALAVSVARYSFAGLPAIRGAFQPDVALPAGAGKDAALRQAADWARSQSPACASHQEPGRG
ncbi:MAG TPA: S41 family peptidase, partial [Telluria sp.]